MKKCMKRIVCFALMIMIVFAVNTPTKAASRRKLSRSSVSVTVGYTTTIKVIGTNKKVKWSSSNKKIATVSKKGKITGKKPGHAVIIAKIGSAKLRCNVTVRSNSWKNHDDFIYEGAGIHITDLYYSSGRLIAKGKLFNGYYHPVNFLTRRVKIYADGKLIADAYFPINKTVSGNSTVSWSLLYGKNYYKKTNLGAVKNVECLY